MSGNFGRWKKRIQRTVGNWMGIALDQVRYVLFTTWEIVTWPISATWQWFVQGWEHRHTRDLIRGLPALAAIMGVVLLSAVARVDAKSLGFNYWMKASQAIARKDYRSAEVYLTRITEMEPENRRAEFALGEVFEKTQRRDRAQSLFKKMAPDGERGFPPAHRMRAFSLADGIKQSSSNEEMHLLRRHLMLADEKDSPGIARAWAAYYLAIGQAEPAIARLEKAVGEFPELSHLLGKLYLDVQQVERAYHSYVAASDFFRSRLENDPDNATLRITFADTLLRLNQLDECEKVLALGMTLDPKGPYKQMLAQALAILYVTRHDQLVKKENVPISALLRQLHSALNYDPNCVHAYERLLKYGDEKADGGFTSQEILREVARGEEPGLAHFAMSILTFKKKDYANTKFHLERAHSLLPVMPFISNNLAMVLVTDKPVEPEKPEQQQARLDRALTLIEPVVKEYPEDPRFLDTRATIFMEQEKWDPALDDLERALRSQQTVQERVALHVKLALIYDKLNKPELAAMHRNLVTNPETPLPERVSRPVLPARDQE